MSWLQVEMTLLDLARGTVGFALNWLLQSTLLIAAGLAIARLISRRGSAAQSVVYCTTLAAVLVCPPLTWAISTAGISGWSIEMPRTRKDSPTGQLTAAQPILRTPAQETSAARRFPVSRGAARTPAAEAPREVMESDPETIPAERLISETGSPADLVDSGTRGLAESSRFPLASRLVLFSVEPFGVLAVGLSLLWVSISGWLLMRLGVAWWRLTGIRRGAISAETATLRVCHELSARLGVIPPAVLHTPFLPSPCLAGVLVPAVLLPETELRISLRDVLIHELAHLHRRDGHWNLLRKMATGMFWFQPLLWSLSRRIEMAAEEVCDDFVVELGGNRTEYANRLVDVAEFSSVPMATAAVAFVSLRSMLAQRVTRIMDTSRRLSTRVSRSLVAGALAGGCVGTLIIGFVGAAPHSGAKAERLNRELSATSPPTQKPNVQSAIAEAFVGNRGNGVLAPPEPARDSLVVLEPKPIPDGPSAPTAAPRGPLPGLISAPVPLPGNRRWQMFSKNLGRTVGAVGWSPESRWLAVATGCAVRIFDTAGLPELQKMLVGHTGSVRAVNFSPDGQWIATAAIDGTVRIWDLEGREQLVYRDHKDAVHDVAWHPDGKRLASASLDGTVRIWSLEGSTIASLAEHEAPVNAVAWSPDGQLLASGCENKVIRYWSPEGVPGPIVEGHLGPVKSLAWNFDGTQLLSCDFGIDSSDGEVADIAQMKIWNRLGRQLNSVSVDFQLTHVCWSPDGTVALGGGFWSICMWPVAARKPPVHLTAMSADVPVAWRPSGDLIAAGAQLRDADGRALNAIPVRNVELKSLARNPDGSLLAVGRASQAFDLFNSDGERVRKSKPLLEGTWVQTVCWSPDGKTFIPVPRYSKALQRYDATGIKSGAPIPLPADIRSIDWSRDGRFVATGGDGMAVLLVDLQTSQAIQIGKQAHGITQVRFTPDQQQICSSGFDGCVRFWSRDGKPGKVLEAVSAPIRGMAWASDGTLLATGHEDHTIRFWNGDGQTENIVGGHGGFVEALDFNPAGTLLASGSWDNTVRIWHRDGSPVSILRGHEGAVYGVQWTPDGRGIFSCGDDGTVRLWDAASGETQWQALLGAGGGYVTLDSQGRVKHGNQRILESDYVFFAEDEAGRLVRTEWAEIRSAIETAGILVGAN